MPIPDKYKPENAVADGNVTQQTALTETFALPANTSLDIFEVSGPIWITEFLAFAKSDIDATPATQMKFTHNGVVTGEIDVCDWRTMNGHPEGQVYGLPNAIATPLGFLDAYSPPNASWSRAARITQAGQLRCVTNGAAAGELQVMMWWRPILGNSTVEALV